MTEVRARSDPAAASRHPSVLARLRRAVLARSERESTMLSLAAAVGLLTGLLATLLIAAIHWVSATVWGTAPSRAAVVAIPAVGGLLVGLLVRYVDRNAAGSGVPELMQVIALDSGRVPVTTPLTKLAATAIGLGTGNSGGREGPIVMMGGGTGSLLGRLFALDEERKRTLIAAGAGAGIAAAFNAPIGGMLFALEVIVGGFKMRSLQVIVVASVVSSVVAREFIGATLIYQPATDYRLNDPRELLLYVLLGLAAAAVGNALTIGKYSVKRWAAQSRLWLPLRPAVGGLAVGVIMLGVPSVFGTGEGLPVLPGLDLFANAGFGPEEAREPIQTMLDGGVSAGWTAVGVLLLLMVAKLVASALAMGSGNSVGSFAPAVFIGAALGGAIGHLTAVLLPQAGIQPGAYALVGMAAVFAASARAPLTGILIAFELTSDYGLVLPLMLATGLATYVAERAYAPSIYTYPLLAKGLLYREPEDIDIMQIVQVGEVMTRDPDTVPEDLTLDDCRTRFTLTRHHGFPVVRRDDPRRLVGVVTLSDLEAAGEDAATVGDICTRGPLTVTPADPVFRALRRMAAIDVGRLPVVSAEDHGVLVGLIRRSDLVRAYQRALTRSLGVQQRRESSRLRDLAGAHFAEVVVVPTAPAVGLPVRAVEWPERTVLTSIRRDGEVVMPNGNTIIQAGDEVVFITARGGLEAVRAQLVGPTGETLQR